MNNKQEMWNNAFQKIDEKYITEAAEYAPDGQAEKNQLRGTIRKSRGGNIIFALSAVAAVLACTIGAGLFLGDRGGEIPVTPSASADSHIRTDEPEETVAVTSTETTTAVPEITAIYDEEIPADAVIIGEVMTTDYVTLALPLDPKFAQITTYFGYDSWRGGGHEGIDFGAEGCHGGNIYAAESGTVVEVRTEYVEDFDDGMYLRIDHGNGLETFYSHCSAIYVKEGDTVGRGDVIASIGATGWATGPHLHFETILNGEKVDPLRYISLAEKDLTLNDVKELAKTGADLDWRSFFGYKCTTIEGYETVTKVYSIDDVFSVRVSGSQREPADYVCLTAYRDGEIYSEIDLRTAGSSLDRFIELAKAEQSDFTLSRPVENPVINSPFADYAGHTGIDFAARTGTEIYAAADGVVTWAEWQDGYGLMIAVAHENDIVTLYSQCSELLVSEGDAVKKGQLIAVTGSTGLVTGECLHFEMQMDGIAVNPEFYFE